MYAGFWQEFYGPNPTYKELRDHFSKRKFRVIVVAIGKTPNIAALETLVKRGSDVHHAMDFNQIQRKPINVKLTNS